ncbi:PilX N-terminal domain-containing pilus assembly protein [Pseudoxanthomonas mexicana]|uniref:pilus assembly PilX family protein n=1 Tax=Pseudoxanthomonas mexicana TaxID=128785 RepID=UPI0009F8E11D|nr:PilX N-terminal domain-containing pilus assembly protein [Pseudoxanthomonas mexicana]
MTTRHKPPSTSLGTGHDGIALVVVLVLLVVTALLGVAVMRSSAMQERMAANLRDRSLAFEAVESTLRYVQNQVMSVGSMEQAAPVANDCATRSVCPRGSAAAWRAAPASAYDSARLPVAPEYWVEHIGEDVANMIDDDNQCGAAGQAGAANQNCRTQIYRVIVRSRSEGRADVVIQANVAGGTQQAGP